MYTSSKSTAPRLLGFIVILLILIVGSFFLLHPILRAPQSTPLSVAEQFIGEIELDNLGEARAFMDSTFKNNPNSYLYMRNIQTYITPESVHLNVMNQTNDMAEVQFLNVQGGALILKQINGSWYIADPSEVPQQQQQQ